MNTNVFFLCLLALVVGCQHKSREQKWSVKANYYESCSCHTPCPCPYGLPMTNSFCKLNGLIDIESGHYDNIDLKGVRVILSGSSGKWGEYIFSENTTPEQTRSLHSILEMVDVAGFDTLLGSRLAKIRFEHTEGRVAFSAPGISVVMNMVRGRENQPVIVQNLPKKIFENYRPYLSDENIRAFADPAHDFSFKGKAGFVSSWDLNEDDFIQRISDN